MTNPKKILDDFSKLMEYFDEQRELEETRKKSIYSALNGEQPEGNTLFILGWKAGRIDAFLSAKAMVYDIILRHSKKKRYSKRLRFQRRNRNEQGNIDI